MKAANWTHEQWEQLAKLLGWTDVQEMLGDKDDRHPVLFGIPIGKEHHVVVPSVHQGLRNLEVLIQQTIARIQQLIPGSDVSYELHASEGVLWERNHESLNKCVYLKVHWEEDGPLKHRGFYGDWASSIWGATVDAAIVAIKEIQEMKESSGSS